MIIPPYDYSAKRGRVMVVASAVFFSLTGVFVKLIPADGWTIVVLRGVFITIFFGGLVLWWLADGAQKAGRGDGRVSGCGVGCHIFRCG